LALLPVNELVDVIVRTKSSALFSECLESIPVLRIADRGSADRTNEMASSYGKVDFPDLNLGGATQFGFSRVQTDRYYFTKRMV
jgi:hypothetical protein